MSSLCTSIHHIDPHVTSLRYRNQTTRPQYRKLAPKSDRRPNRAQSPRQAADESADQSPSQSSERPSVESSVEYPAKPPVVPIKQPSVQLPDQSLKRPPDDTVNQTRTIVSMVQPYGPQQWYTLQPIWVDEIHTQTVVTRKRTYGWIGGTETAAQNWARKAPLNVMVPTMVNPLLASQLNQSRKNVYPPIAGPQTASTLKTPKRAVLKLDTRPPRCWRNKTLAARTRTGRPRTPNTSTPIVNSSEPNTPEACMDDAGADVVLSSNANKVNTRSPILPEPEAEVDIKKETPSPDMEYESDVD